MSAPVKAKHPGGRPTTYRSEFNSKAYELAKHGLLNDMIATELGVSVDTFYEWLERNPGFSQSVTRGKCEFDAVYVKHYHSLMRPGAFEKDDVPDTARRAIEWWLMNRHRKELVGERVEMEGVGPSPAAIAWEQVKKRLKLK